MLIFQGVDHPVDRENIAKSGGHAGVCRCLNKALTAAFAVTSGVAARRAAAFGGSRKIGATRWANDTCASVATAEQTTVGQQKIAEAACNPARSGKLG